MGRFRRTRRLRPSIRQPRKMTRPLILPRRPTRQFQTSTTDPQTTVDPTTSNTSIDSQPVTPVVVSVPVVDQTDLGDSPPPASAAASTDSTSDSTSSSTLAVASRSTSTSPTDSSDATTTSTAPVVRPQGTGQSSDDQAMDSGLSFMHVSLPPMLGGSHDGVSGFHPVYVSAALNTQQPSNRVARDSMTADASGSGAEPHERA